MTLPNTISKHRLVLKGYEAIINASKASATEPKLAETTQVIVIEKEHEEIDDTKRENKFRAITSILTDCLKAPEARGFKMAHGWA